MVRGRETEGLKKFLRSRGSEGLEKYLSLVESKKIRKAEKYLEDNKTVKEEYFRIIDEYISGVKRRRDEIRDTYPELGFDFNELDKELSKDSLLVSWVNCRRRTNRPL